MQTWKIIHVFLTPYCVVGGGNANDLTLVITQSFMEYRGLTNQKLTQRFICFGVDGVFFFSGLLHLSDSIIEKEIFSLHDGVTLYGSYNKPCCNIMSTF
jgi:hypothetical protein